MTSTLCRPCGLSLSPASVSSGRSRNSLRIAHSRPPCQQLLVGVHHRCQVVAEDRAASVSAAVRRPTISIMSRLAACIEFDDIVRRYEELAGRSAMIGILVSIFIELITDHSLFNYIQADQLNLFVTGGIGMVSLGAALAFFADPAQQIGQNLSEAVVSSLTAAKRSAASVTQSQVDGAVDALFDSAFGRSTMFDVTLMDASLDDTL